MGGKERWVQLDGTLKFLQWARRIVLHRPRAAQHQVALRRLSLPKEPVGKHLALAILRLVVADWRSAEEIKNVAILAGLVQDRESSSIAFLYWPIRKVAIAKQDRYVLIVRLGGQQGAEF